MNKQAYWEGYAEACHAHGVNPHALTKQALSPEMIAADDGMMGKLQAWMRANPRAAMAAAGGLGAAGGGLAGYGIGGDARSALLGAGLGGAAGAGGMAAYGPAMRMGGWGRNEGEGFDESGQPISLARNPHDPLWGWGMNPGEGFDEAGNPISLAPGLQRSTIPGL